MAKTQLHSVQKDYSTTNTSHLDMSCSLPTPLLVNNNTEGDRRWSPRASSITYSLPWRSSKVWAEILPDLTEMTLPTQKAIHKLFSWSFAMKKINPQKFLQVLKSNFYWTVSDCLFVCFRVFIFFFLFNRDRQYLNPGILPTENYVQKVCFYFADGCFCYIQLLFLLFNSQLRTRWILEKGSRTMKENLSRNWIL